MATLKLSVFWSSRKLTSLRGGASALPPLTIFHSLSALQRWQNCTLLGPRQQQSRCCCIPAQHRRAAMTRPPRAAAAQIKAVLVRAAGGGGGGRGAPSRKYKRKLVIHTSQCVTVPVLMHAPLVHAVATALARPARKLILFLFFSQWTPLHLSAMNDHLEVCRLLLQCNADIEAKDG
jgi:hypothetical protein